MFHTRIPAYVVFLYAFVVVIGFVIRGVDYALLNITNQDRILTQDVNTGLSGAKNFGNNTQPRSSLLPATDADEIPTRILHVVWGRPQPGDTGYGGVERVLDDQSFTGCCDVLIEIALKSYVALLPGDFQIDLWSMGGWNHTGYLKHIGLGNSNVQPMEFDPLVELAGDPNLIHVYESLRSVVPRSDFVRYVLMKNYGGSYVDLDGIMVRTLPYDGVPRVNLSPEVGPGRQTCEGEGYTRKPHTCTLSNGMFVGFPPNHTFFHILVHEISATKRTCGGDKFFCYSPGWMTTTLMRAGIFNVADIGVRVEQLLRNKGQYQDLETCLISHWDLDVGDISCNENKFFSDLCMEYNISQPSLETPAAGTNTTEHIMHNALSSEQNVGIGTGLPSSSGGMSNEAHVLIDTNVASPRILHVVWGRPQPDDSGYGGAERVLDNESFTGCCDNLIELALKSYVALLPNDFQIVLWNMGGWNHTGYLKHIGLGDANVLPMHFDPLKELAGDHNLLDVYKSLRSVVPRSDLTRYVLMRNYGGSYVDLDGIMVRTLPYDGIPRVNLSPAEAGGRQNCEGEGYTRQPGTCTLSNGMFVGFPANHTFFQILLDNISATKRTCGGTEFLCYSPEWMTKTLMKEGIMNVADIGVQVEPLLRGNGLYKNQKTILISHWDLDTGDLMCDYNKFMEELCRSYNVSHWTPANSTKPKVINPKRVSSTSDKIHTPPGCNACKHLEKFESIPSKGSLVFVHIPKTGGTVVERALGIEGKPCHVTAGALLKCDRTRYDAALSFAVIRHPLDRMYSLYHFARANRDEFKNSTLDEFIIEFNAFDRIFAPMTYYIGGDLALHVKKILCFDKLADDWESMVKSVPSEHIPVLNTEQPETEELNVDVFEFPLTINSTSFERIQKTYGEDYKLWNHHCNERDSQHQFLIEEITSNTDIL